MPGARLDSREHSFLSQVNTTSVKESAPSAIFEKYDIIGKGAYGAVYKGAHIPTGYVVALKIINLDTADDDVDDIQKEVSLLKRLMIQGGIDARKETGNGSHNGQAIDWNHYGVPNVIKYYGCWTEGPKVWIVMELAEGGSVRTLARATQLNEIQISLISKEVLNALTFLHKNGVIHRDIKAANILITSAPNRVLLCDFGVSALLPSQSAKRTTFVGTPYWMAPEVISKGRSYDFKADIWSFGITVLEMALGQPPLMGQSAAEALSLIPKSSAPRLQGRWSDDMKDFVASALQEDPEERSPADEIAKHKWIKKHSKSPLTYLNDLLVNLEAWKSKGNQRISLAPGAGAFVGEDDDDTLWGDDDWQFNTTRSRRESEEEQPLRDWSSGLSNLLENNVDTLSESTIAMSNAPRSLFRLFETQETDDIAVKMPKATDGQDGSTLRNRSHSKGHQQTFSQSQNAGNVNTIRLPGGDDDSDDEIALDFKVDMSFGADTMKPSNGFQPGFMKGNEWKSHAIASPYYNVTDTIKHVNDIHASHTLQASNRDLEIHPSSALDSNMTVKQSGSIPIDDTAEDRNAKRKGSDQTPAYEPNFGFSFPRNPSTVMAEEITEDTPTTAMPAFGSVEHQTRVTEPPSDVDRTRSPSANHSVQLFKENSRESSERLTGTEALLKTDSSRQAGQQSLMTAPTTLGNSQDPEFRRSQHRTPPPLPTSIVPSEPNPSDDNPPDHLARNSIPDNKTHAPNGAHKDKGPYIRAINSTLLFSQEALFSELRDTASDLGLWLDVVHQGLDELLSQDTLDSDVSDNEEGVLQNGSQLPPIFKE